MNPSRMSFREFVTITTAELRRKGIDPDAPLWYIDLNNPTVDRPPRVNETDTGIFIDNEEPLK